MFETFRKIMRGFFSLIITYYVAWFILLAVAAILNFGWSIYQGRFAEAATQYILVAIVAAVIAFVVWVSRDSAEASHRFEKHLKKSAVETDDEEDEDEDQPELPSSEHIRPAPRQTL